MKHFFNKISFFLIAIFVVWMILECFYRFAPNNYTEKHKYIQDNYDSAEVLIFGNSHTFYGLNPDKFDNPAFNIANISQSIYFDKLLFDKHFDRFKNLNYVILNIEYTSLSHQDNTQEDVWRKYFYKSQMGLDVSIISFYDPKQYSLALSRSFKNSLNSLQYFLKNKTLSETTSSGWASNYTFENRKLNLEELSYKVTQKHEDQSVDFKLNTQRLQAIIDKCKDKNIEVILVTMPVHKSYSEKVNQQKLTAIFDIAQQLANKNSNTSYLNLFSDNQFTEDDFYDPDHLNNKGSDKCSEIVNTFIEHK
jgi:hypothetical protein